MKSTVRFSPSRYSANTPRLPTDREIVDIMRPSPWGNPFTVATFGRGECIDRFEAWLKTQYALLNERWRLRGRSLRCCCRREARCHGDVWCRVADMTADELMDWMLDVPAPTR